jgi:Putative protein-S-isoprenylcysteine methyltransferase
VSGFWIALAAGTVFLLVFSWFSSIRENRLHGYPRFFAFEGVFVLILLNLRSWFRDPFSPRQILSWILMLSSLAAVSAGFLTLRRHGRAEGNFEKTTRIVDRGIYGRIRHPMYASLIFLAAGVFLKDVRAVPAVVLAVVTAAALAAARLDEREMTARFGAAYADYMKRTKRFIPFLW